MRRTPYVALAVACVISGRTSASGRLYVSVSRRLIRSRDRSGAKGCGWDGRGVVSKGRGALGTAEDKKLQLEGTAGRAGVQVVQGTWWRERWRGPRRLQEAKGRACAEREMRRRRAAGWRLRNSARDQVRVAGGCRNGFLAFKVRRGRNARSEMD